jgi:GNAT superfamily N-acetyltransferase
MDESMKIIKAKEKDLPEILELVAACTKKMESEGNLQWSDDYPTEDILRKDITKGDLFVLNDGGKILGIIALTYKEEPQYADIEWEDKSGNALEVHRMGVHPKHQSEGVGKRMFEFAQDHALKNGYSSIRMDTYFENDSMIGLIEGLGYKRKKKEIFFPPLIEPFYCYEKLLK